MGARNLTIRHVPIGKGGAVTMRTAIVDALTADEIRQARAWHLIHTSASREVEAARLLRLMGLMAWVPRGECFKRVGRNSNRVRLTPTRYAALAGYLFIGVRDGAADWKALAETGLVRGVVGARVHNGVAPYAVAPRDMVRLTERQRNGEFDLGADHALKARTLPDVKPGEIWRIGHGPLRGYDVPVIAVNGAVARVLIDLFKIQKPVEIRLDAFDRAVVNGKQR